jgi:hypothetical protein
MQKGLYFRKVTPLEGPAIHVRDNGAKISIPHRDGEVKATSFLTGLACSSSPGSQFSTLYLTVILMIILMSLGFATVPESTANPTAGTGSLVSTVGNKPFVGDSSRGTLDLNGWNPAGGR